MFSDLILNSRINKLKQTIETSNNPQYETALVDIKNILQKPNITKTVIENNEELYSKAIAILKAAKNIADGTSTDIWYPDASGFYPYLWTRDFAYLLEGYLDYFTATQIENVFRLIASKCNTTTYEVPDHIGKDGTVYWTPGLTNDWGSRASLDGNPFLVDICYYHYRKTGKTTLYNEFKTFLKNIMEVGLPYNATTGCVTISDDTPCVGYGFRDIVKTSGDDLFSSLLAYQAFIQLFEMAHENGDSADAKDFYDRSVTLKNGINDTFWSSSTLTGDYRYNVGEVGMYKAATIKCKDQNDVWGSAFAVWLGVADNDKAYAIAKNFLNSYRNNATSGLHYKGGIRHVLKTDEYQAGINLWESYYNTSIAYGTYQNGGYWATPLLWAYYTMLLIDQEVAGSLLIDCIANHLLIDADAPYEWLAESGSKGAAKYCSSITLPLLLVKTGTTTSSSSTSIIYDVTYNSTTGLLPTESTPVWTLAQSGTPTIAVASSILNIACNTGAYAIYQQDTTSILASNTKVFEIKAKLNSGGTGENRLQVSIYDGVKGAIVGVKQNGDIFYYNPNYVLISSGNATTTDFILRCEVDDVNGLKVYFNNVLISTIPYVNLKSDVLQMVNFGVASANATVNADVYYVRYTLNKTTA